MKRQGRGPIPAAMQGRVCFCCRAYMRYCDGLFFPPFFALAALTVAVTPHLSFWFLSVLLLVAMVLGMYCYSRHLAGVPVK